MSFSRAVHFAARAASFFVVSVFASQCFAQSSVKDEKASNFYYLKKLNSVFEFVQQNYVDEVDPKILYEGAMKGLMNAFNDPYSSYLDTDTIRDLSDTTSGKFGGVGLSISKPVESTAEKPAYVEVASPIEDSPGAKAGILAGDYLIAIEGKPTPEMTMQEVLDMLRGKVGTPVTVEVLRGKNMTFSVTLVREMIEVPTVKYGMIEKNGYLRIIQFTPETPGRVQEAIDSFKENDFIGMIIDLRDNPGGLITSVVEVADKFIDDGPIVATKSRLSFENSVYTAKAKNTVVRDIPIVVLINHGSASASEILSGALKDYHLAYLVGKRSYGKGSVQQVIPLSENEEIKLTMARYYTPSDANIDKIGIQPDLEIGYPDFSEEDEKAYVELIKSNVIGEYVDAHPGMDEAAVSAFADTLKETYNLDSRLLRRLVRIQATRTQPSRLYDLDYDIQLNKALEIVSATDDFKKLVASTKTLKQLQDEESIAADGEKTAVLHE